MIVYVVIAALAVVLPLLLLTQGRPALQHWRHERCLDRIALLERSCGLDVSEPARLPQRSAADALARWHEAMSTQRAAYAKRVLDGQARRPDDGTEAHRREIARRERAERKSGRGQHFGR